MSNYMDQRAIAAKWIYERRTPRKWYTWVVLTEHNVGDQNPGIDDTVASLIFGDFAAAGMLIPSPVPKHGYGAYVINEAKLKEWQEAAHPWRWCFRKNVRKVLGWLVLSVFSAAVGLCVGLWWEALFGK